METSRIRPARWPCLIACLSDTHIPRRSRALPLSLRERLRHVDAILHAGDIVADEVLRELRTMAPTTAVTGNMDPPGLTGAAGPVALVRVGSWKIGLVHGHEGKGATTAERAFLTFVHPPGGDGSDDRPEIVVFGHSHQPVTLFREGVLLLNPGSPTDPRFAPRPTFALLRLDDPEPVRLPHAEIIPL